MDLYYRYLERKYPNTRTTIIVRQNISLKAGNETAEIAQKCSPVHKNWGNLWRKKAEMINDNFASLSMYGLEDSRQQLISIEKDYLFLFFQSLLLRHARY